MLPWIVRRYFNAASSVVTSEFWRESFVLHLYVEFVNIGIWWNWLIWCTSFDLTCTIVNTLLMMTIPRFTWCLSLIDFSRNTHCLASLLINWVVANLNFLYFRMEVYIFAFWMVIWLDNVFRNLWIFINNSFCKHIFLRSVFRLIIYLQYLIELRLRIILLDGLLNAFRIVIWH